MKMRPKRADVVVTTVHRVRVTYLAKRYTADEMEELDKRIREVMGEDGQGSSTMGLRDITFELSAPPKQRAINQLEKILEIK